MWIDLGGFWGLSGVVRIRGWGRRGVLPDKRPSCRFLWFVRPYGETFWLGESFLSLKGCALRKMMIGRSYLYLWGISVVIIGQEFCARNRRVNLYNRSMQLKSSLVLFPFLCPILSPFRPFTKYYKHDQPTTTSFPL